MSQKPVPAYLNFLFGGLAGMSAAAIVHPFDVIKNGMQLAATTGSPASITDVVGSIMKNYGISGLYKGLSASLLRQATYTSARLGVFNVSLNLMTGADGTPPNFVTKAALGLISGGCGAMIGNPADLCLVRMTADARLPPEQRRNYNNVFNAIVRIVAEEGPLTLWRGCLPTVVRGCVVNASQLAIYTQTKQILLQTAYFEEGLMTHFGASMFSGFCTLITSMPFDILKTRLQNMKIVDGVPDYTGSVDVFMKIIGREGVFALWRGFVPYYMRLGPYSVLMFVFLEQMMTAYKK